VALAAVLIGAVFLSNFIAHAATVALMFPIGLSMATDLGISFMPFAIIIINFYFNFQNSSDDPPSPRIHAKAVWLGFGCDNHGILP
jgi:hypothetical protein